MRGGRILAMVLVGALAVAPAACGDDDSSGDDAASDGTTDGLTDAERDTAASFLGEDCEFLLAGAYLSPAAAFTSGSGFDFEENQTRLQALADDAPDEVRDDLTLIAERIGRMHEALGDVDLTEPGAYADPEVQAAVEQLDTIFDQDYQDAAQALSSYVASHCTGVGG